MTAIVTVLQIDLNNVWYFIIVCCISFKASWAHVPDKRTAVHMMWSPQAPALILVLISVCNGLSRHPLLLIVSFDGFRYDFFSKCPTPGLDAFKSAGTHAPYTRNVFPTKTFPNHQSIATGLFPESHGVLGNEVYDSSTNRILHFGPEMYNTPGITPIWVSW